MALKVTTLRKSPVKPAVEDDNAEALWEQIAALDKLSEDKSTAAGAESTAVKALCAREGINVKALTLFRTLNKKSVADQSDFLRSFDLLTPRLACRRQLDMQFEEGR